MKIALVHDMAESIVGDIAPMDNVSKEEKHRREKVTCSSHGIDPELLEPVKLLFLSHLFSIFALLSLLYIYASSPY